MYPISNAVKALFDAEQRQVLRITGTDKNNVSISITDADVTIGSFSIDRYSCNGDKLEVGTAVAAEMSLTLDNHDGRFNDVVFEGTELFVEVGIADWSQSNPTVSWIPCGHFTPDEQPRKLTTISIKALDRMTYFDKKVDAAALTFPMTVAALAERAGILCNMLLGGSISGLPNASVVITGLPEAIGDITYRNIIQWCAGIMGTNAWVDWYGGLRFSWYNGASTGYATTVANRFNSDYYEDDLTVTGVVYTNASGVEIVEGTDDYAIDLTGNALVGPLVATVLPAIDAALNGFSYRPFTASVINAPYLWPMDAVVFTDKDGNDHASALTNVAFGINGATAIESKGLTAALNARKQPAGVTKDQAQLISEAMEHVEQDIDESLTQQEIFNRLTDNGAAQGLMLYNGQLYVNASYIQSGTLRLGGLDNVNGLFELLDASGDVAIRGDNTGIAVGTGSISTNAVGQYIGNRGVTLKEGQVQIYGGNTYLGKIGFTDNASPTLEIDSGTAGGGMSLTGPQSQRTYQGYPVFYRPSIDLKGSGVVQINYHDLKLFPEFDDSTITLGGNAAAALRTALGVSTSDYAIYNSVTDLGLTSGSATVLAAFNAMGTNAILICPAGEFASGEVPNTYGTVEIVIPSASARSYIHFYGKDSSRMDWRMYLEATAYNGNNGNLPSGEWVQLITIDNVYNGLDKTASGFALDARQGKALNDTMTMVGNGAFNLGSISAGASKVLKASSSTHAMLVLSGPNVNLFGLYLIRISTSGTPNTVTVTQGSNVTFTPADGKITIGNTASSGSISVNVIPLSGDSSNFSLT